MRTFSILGMETDFSISLGALILLTLPTIGRLVYDWYTIKVKQVEVNHKEHTIVTGIFIVALSIIVWAIEPVKYLFQPIILSIGIFSTFFDYILNLIRGKNFFYIDLGLDGKQSFFDSVYARLGIEGTILLKVWVLMFAVGVYFYWSMIVGDRPAY